MKGLFYQDFGAVKAGRDDPVQQRLRRAQIERALGEAACLGIGGAASAARAATPALSGEVLEKDDPGGDGARIIAPGNGARWRAP